MIECSNIDLIYDGREIFNRFSLSVQAGEKILITGKSGSGKSTLFDVLLGFASVDCGEIYINGEKTTTENIASYRKFFAYVNQDVTLRQGKVNDVLCEISKFSGNGYRGGLDKELAAFFEFDVHLLEKEMDELSGGERQRLGIILAIMLHRPVFLLDEVTSALDRDLKQKVVQYFSSCEQAVISISHDREWLADNCFREVTL